MTDNPLQELRSQVDVINLQILELLNKRASIAADIGKVQAQLGTQQQRPVQQRNDQGTFPRDFPRVDGTGRKRSPCQNPGTA
jgi:hypothetical protein